MELNCLYTDNTQQKCPYADNTWNVQKFKYLVGFLAKIKNASDS